MGFRLGLFAIVFAGLVIWSSCGDYKNFNAGHDSASCVTFWLSLLYGERKIAMEDAVREERANAISWLADATRHKVLSIEGKTGDRRQSKRPAPCAKIGRVPESLV